MCERLEVHVAVLAHVCPMAVFVEVSADLVLEVASFLRRRRALAVENRLALASTLQLELALRFPTRLGVVAQTCSLLPCLAVQGFVV